MPINWRFFLPNFVDIEVGLLELFENVTGVRFFLRHSVEQNDDGYLPANIATDLLAKQMDMNNMFWSNVVSGQQTVVERTFCIN